MTVALALAPPGRSAAYAGESMIATAHPMATTAGVDVLRRGGNAVDAAIAAAAMLAVVEPAMSGLGGDCFALVARGDERGMVRALNGSGAAPLAASADGRAIDPYSPGAVTLPGAVAAWDRLVADHGTRPLVELLEPAIAAAREGYVVTPRVAFDWQCHASVLRRHLGAASVFLSGNRPPMAGERAANADLARSLERIADHGATGFYDGPTAETIIAHLRSLGGVHTLDDMATVQPEYVDPISTDYRGYTVHECPPNGAGVTALAMLNILSGFDLAALDPAGVARLHLEIEAGRLARADRDAVVADPQHGDVPVARMLSAQHADAHRARIDPGRRIDDMSSALASQPAHTDTTYVCAVDSERTAISLICSVFGPFGSGIVPPGTGIILQNRGLGFSSDPAHSNCIAGGKRPLHTIIPALVTKRDGDADRVVMPFGVMGGHYQPVGQCHVLTNVVDYWMDPQQAIDFPRAHHDDGEVVIERSYGEQVARGLLRLEHRTRTSDEPIGGGQAIWIDDERGCLVGGSDRRKDGIALGWR